MLQMQYQHTTSVLTLGREKSFEILNQSLVSSDLNASSTQIKSRELKPISLTIESIEEADPEC